MKWLFTLCGIFFSVSVYAFIPPLNSILKEVFNNRPPGRSIEARLKHRIELPTKEVVEIEERILIEQKRDRSEFLFLWRKFNDSQGISARWDNGDYYVSKNNRLPIGSKLLVNYLLSNSIDSFRDSLLAEQFISPDQVNQYKPGFNPQGDPGTWNLKENYIRHEDIFLSRLSQGVAIQFQGPQVSSITKSIYFDEKLRGIFRLEWNSADRIIAWNFEGLSSQSVPGVFPKRMRFDVNGRVFVESELLSVQKIKDKPLLEFHKSFRLFSSQADSIPQNMERAMKLLLSNR